MAEGSFRRLLAATALSDTAQGVFTMASVLTAAGAAGSAWLVAAVTAAATLPWLVLGIPIGMVVDSVSRRWTLAAASLGRAALMLLLGWLLLAGNAPAWLLLAAVFLVGALQVMLETSAEAVLPGIVERTGLTRANGQLAVATRVTNQFVGPAAAGVLFGLSAALPYLISAAACLVAVVLQVAVVPTRTAAPGGPARFGAGIRAIARDPVLRTLVTVSGVTTLANAAFLTALVPYAVAPGPLMLSSAAYGVTVSVIGVGAAVGSLLTARLAALVGRARVLWLSRVGWALLFTSPLVTGGWVFMLLAGAGSILGGMWAVMALTVRQTTVPRELLGQVAGATRSLTYGATPIGAALGGALTAAGGASSVFLSAAAITLLLIVPLRRSLSERRLRAAEDRVSTG
ncbi:MFS transporter [Actinophytocola xanthii]|uniref:MFS transporter n=1 Tax=Actinophytocola xanthii TaxID=1912961 RepID=A0A1Q8CK80_9PSEU|nr:MFS transporter [Actinophytocola xanthii]OLF14756.1 hypothetical protein BU204_25440 [Actinophytocola xanthii]